jgi:hypothetical protein
VQDGESKGVMDDLLESLRSGQIPKRNAAADLNPSCESIPAAIASELARRKQSTSHFGMLAEELLGKLQHI